MSIPAPAALSIPGVYVRLEQEDIDLRWLIAKSRSLNGVEGWISADWLKENK
jgi:hypothetical protein